jgi:predicted DNA-binding transcriptional regulator AlpA
MAKAMMAQATVAGEKLLTVTQVAGLTGYSQGYFVNLVKRGLFPPPDFTFGTGLVRRVWKQSTVDAFLREQGRGA